MTKDASKSRKTDAGAARKARLASALKENLRRRKAQARARREEEGGGEPQGPPETGDHAP